jgi:hypothetical protein
MRYSELTVFFMGRYKRRRIEYFCQRFPPSSYKTILDVGGTPQIWETLGMPYTVTLLNNDPREINSATFKCVVGDGCELEWKDKAFDVAFSNSVIEHVGTRSEMERFACELQRVGRTYYCQTPNKWFPIEPHLGTLFLHWWPRLLNCYFVTRYFTLWGILEKPNRSQVKVSLANIHLLTRRQLQHLFPDAEILRERFFLFTKSYTAMTRHPEVANDEGRSLPI